MDLRLLKSCTLLSDENSQYYLYKNQGALLIKTPNLKGDIVGESSKLDLLNTLKFDKSVNNFVITKDLISFIKSYKDKLYLYFQEGKVSLYSFSISKREYKLEEDLIVFSVLKDQVFISFDCELFGKVLRFLGKEIEPIVYFNNKYLYVKGDGYEVYLFQVSSGRFLESISK